jgi:preprotein translocase subunit SecF
MNKFMVVVALVYFIGMASSMVDAEFHSGNQVKVQLKGRELDYDTVDKLLRYSEPSDQ